MGGAGIVLASSSPRRKAILRKLGFRFRCIDSGIVERAKKGSAKENAGRLALRKARAVAKLNRNAVVIGADTIVEMQGKFYPKAKGAEEAEKALNRLSGKWHGVWTGVALVKGKSKIVFCEKARVKMKKLSQKEIRGYVAGGEALGKAGCYNIAGKGKKLIEKVVGEPECVAGLPKRKMLKELRRIVAH